MAKTPSSTPFNWYEVLGCSIESSKEHIAKAARKAALKYHPDRNADPKAKELFLQIQNAKDFLLDDSKRKELDEYLTSIKKRKAQEERRNLQMDGKRKRMKSDLEQRVQQAKEQKDSFHDRSTKAASASQDPNILKHLQRENAARMEAAGREQSEREEKRKRDLDHLAFLVSLDQAGFRVKVKWRTKDESHSEDSLYQLMKKFGSIEHVLIIPGKGNQAIISFTCEDSARAAVDAYATSDAMRVTLMTDLEKKKRAAVFTHDYGQAAASSIPASTGGVHDLAAEMRRVLEREDLLRSLQTEGSGRASFNVNVTSTAEQSSDASGRAEGSSPPVVDLKAKENDILARMKLAAQKKQAELSAKDP